VEAGEGVGEGGGGDQCSWSERDEEEWGESEVVGY
jgi:hypothetical protein